MIFDIGGVFIGLDFSRAVSHTAAALGMPAVDVRQRLFGAGNPLSADRMDFMNDYECGRIDDAAFHRCVERVLDAPLPFAEFKAAWNGIFLDPIFETMHMAEALCARGDLKLGILSNNNALHWSALRPILPIVDKFEHVFLSHEIGLKKPSPEAFQHALQRMSVRAERTLFVDDLEDNIKAAERIGIKTIHAKNTHAVRRGFAAHGFEFAATSPDALS